MTTVSAKHPTGQTGNRIDGMPQQATSLDESISINTACVVQRVAMIPENVESSAQAVVNAQSARQRVVTCPETTLTDPELCTVAIDRPAVAHPQPIPRAAPSRPPTAAGPTATRPGMTASLDSKIPGSQPVQVAAPDSTNEVDAFGENVVDRGMTSTDHPLVKPVESASVVAARAVSAVMPADPTEATECLQATAAAQPHSSTSDMTTQDIVVSDRTSRQPSIAVETRIVATIDVGYGNTLYLRGSGDGLSWDMGLPMTNTAADEWCWSVYFAQGQLEFKFLINDRVWSVGENITVNAGETSISSPRF